MLLRNVCTAFNNKKVVTVGTKNGFIGISNQRFAAFLTPCDQRTLQNSLRPGQLSALPGHVRELQRSTCGRTRDLSQKPECTIRGHFVSSVPITIITAVCGCMKTIIARHASCSRWRWTTAIPRNHTISSISGIPWFHRMILFFLIPVNMIFGLLPPQSLLSQFNFSMVFLEFR